MKRRFFYQSLLIAIAIFGLLTFSGNLSAQGRSDEALERVKEVQEKHTARFMDIEGVEGTGIGSDQNGRLRVEVFVSRSDVADLPKEVEGVPVQVVVTGKFFALGKPSAPLAVDPRSRFSRPVPIGVSTGHPDITAGTIGCRVTDGTNVYALSNNHVYANVNEANIGDNVLQPGSYDGGINPDDAIGTLRDFEEVRFDGTNNVIDAAIALSSTDLLGKATPASGYALPKSATYPASIKLPVKKYGRTTGLTKGKVYAINATVNVDYGASRIARFVNQIVITPGTFSAGGDSGSLIVVDNTRSSHDRKAIGLLFAGSSSYTIANPINPVLTRFGVTIDGE